MGAKHHCAFCGLNALGMAFRSKSPARALAGLDELARRHGAYAFLSVDNILDQRYLDVVFEPLTRQRKDYTFFFEVKSTLTAAQLLKQLTKAVLETALPSVGSGWCGRGVGDGVASSTRLRGGPRRGRVG